MSNENKEGIEIGDKDINLSPVPTTAIFIKPPYPKE